MVHQYKLNGYNIVLDTVSGSVHVVDEVAYDMISLFKDNTEGEIINKMTDKYGKNLSPEELYECLEDIKSLVESKQLFTEDTFEDIAGGVKYRDKAIKALCLHVAHTCNLNCTYCFASQGKYKGERGLMSFEVGKQGIDFLIANSGNRRNLELDFFGGEPLLNFDAVKQIVAYARTQEKIHNKNFRFTLTTNGLNINDEVIEFADREISNVVLSLDGRKEVHDRFRKTNAGTGSYDLVVPKFREFVSKRGDKSYYIRGTFTHFNTDFTKDLFHMADLGFTQLSMEPVVCSPDDPCALTEEDLPVLFEQYELLAKKMLKRHKEGKPITFYHYMIDLEHGPCIYKRISGCGSGTEYLAVTPWGELYPCHQFVGDKTFSMGNVWEGVTNDAIRQNFARCNAYSRQECKNCWAQLYCSGGCAANSYHATGSIGGVYEYGCKLFRKRMECAIMLKAAESLISSGDGKPNCEECENEYACH